MKSWFLFFICWAVACGESSSPLPAEIEAEDVTLTFFRSFASGTYVFRSQAELDSAWAAAPFQIYPVGIVTSEPEKPTYDYSEQMVVGNSLGVGKWCFKQQIYKVERDDTKTLVHFRVPTSSTLACLRDGPLIAFALVSRADGDVLFVQDNNEPVDGSMGGTGLPSF